MKRITIIILFLLLLGAAASFYFYQKNIFSKEVLKLEILGPETVSMGEEIEYTVRYKNQGNTLLEEAELFFEFPESALPSSGEDYVIKDLEAIYPGEESSLKFRARLFGKEGETKKAKATLSYRPKNLRAFFESETTFVSKISQVPITFEIDSPSRIEEGKTFSFRINYFSSADYPLTDLRIKVDYPLGFEFLESDPVALERTEWDIGLLNKAEGGRVEVFGRWTEQSEEKKIFRANLGLWKEGSFVLLKEATRGVQVTSPRLYVSYLLNGSPEYAANPGGLLHFEIFFRNIGEEPFEDLFLVSKLRGVAFDFETLRTEDGDFQKDESFILWDWKKVPLLKFLGPQEEGRVEFWIRLKERWEPAAKNPELAVEVSIAKAKATFSVKVNSLVELEQRVFFEEENFKNEGPIPPKVGEKTTYTVIWRAKNYYNDLENVRARVILPEQIRLTGKILPEDAKLTFDSESREVVWDLGSLEAGSGTPGSIKTIAFQISFEPTQDQKGQTAVLVNQARISGEDLWTKRTVERTASSVDTSLPDDPTVNEEQGVVE